MDKAITVKQLVEEKGKELKLRLVVGKGFLGRKIVVSEINRPGLALTGYLEQFRSERIQVIGRGEYYYCISRSYQKIFKNLDRMFKTGDVPCVVITGGMKPNSAIVDAAKKNNIPLLVSLLNTADFVRELIAYLDEKLAPSTIVHGVLVNVYGLGVLIQGDAGIGKSECAIELLKRGHILISDDVVEIKRRVGHMLIGSSPRTIKNFMEVRGIGIVDVEMIFGVGAILPSSAIELVVYLQSSKGVDLSSYDSTGLEEQTIDILNVSVPMIKIPVTPGRNLAVLIEVASLNQRLKNTGYFAARRLNDIVKKEIKRNSK